MTNHAPIHALRDKLETERLAAIESLAAAGATTTSLAQDALMWLAALQTTLTAVREELELHSVREGWGGEKPLR